MAYSVEGSGGMPFIKCWKVEAFQARFSRFSANLCIDWTRSGWSKVFETQVFTNLFPRQIFLLMKD